MMKRIMTGLAMLLFLVTLQAQTQEYMIIDKADGTSIKLSVEEIRQMYFEKEANPLFGKEADAIDLGLCVKWASWDIGATKVGEKGGYFGWGDPTGLLTSTNDDDYAGSNPPSVISGTEYDIAHVQWGGKWRLPTYYEMEELVNECTWTYETYGGQNCVTAKGSNDKTIVFPLAGYIYGDGDVKDEGKRGNFYIGEFFEKNEKLWGYALWCPKDSDKVYCDYGWRRYMRFSVRAVQGDNVTVITRKSYVFSDGDIWLCGTVAAAIGVNTFTRGFFISKNGTPSSSNNVKKIEDEEKDVSGYFYISNISNLDPGTTYKYCAYVYADGKYYYGATKEFTTNEQQETLTTSSSSVRLDANSGAQGTFSISSNTNWTISGIPSWLSLSKTSGSGDAAITVTTLSANTSTQNNRESELTISTKQKNVTVKVIQDKASVVLTVSPTSIVMPNTSGSTESFAITCNGDWKISGVPSWLNISQTSGNGDATIKLTTKEKYEGVNDRSFETITISNQASGKSAAVKVSQKGVGQIFNVTGTPVELASNANAVGTFTINTNIAFTVSSKADWLEVTPTSGNSTTTITVKAKTANPTSSERSGTISISNALYGSYNIDVKQAGSENTIIYREPYTSWGATKSQVKTYMKNYTLYSEEDNMLTYVGMNLEVFTIYAFDNSKLVMACVAVETGKTTLAKIEEQLQKNDYVKSGVAQDGTVIYGSSDLKTLVFIETDTEVGAYYIRYYDASLIISDELFEEPYTDWGASRNTVKSAMTQNGYTLEEESTDASDYYYLMYQGKYKEVYSMYQFNSRIQLAQIQLLFLASDASMEDIRSYMSSTLSYTFAGTNSDKTQFYYLTADKKSYAIVESATLSNGIELTVVTYVSYSSVSGSRKTSNKSFNDSALQLQDDMTMPSVNVEVDKLQRLLLEKIWMSAKVRLSSWPEMGVKP